MVKFIVTLLLVALAILLVTLYGIPSKPSFLYETLLLLVFSTILLYSYLYRASKPDFFTQLYLLSMAVKFLAYGAYMVVVILMDKAGATENVVFFMMTYIIFTGIEVGFLFNKINGQSGS